MTPAGFYIPFGLDYWFAFALSLDGLGAFDGDTVNYSYTVRPVINIRSNMTITGTGTMTDPFAVA